MDLKGFVDKASAAASKAAAKAAEQLGPVNPPTNVEAGAQAPSLVDGAGQPSAAPVSPTSTPAPSFNLQQLADVGTQKVQELVTAFQNALPAIKMAGYELTEFEVELGLTPKLIPHFRHAARSVEDVDGARAALKDNKVGSLVLSTLLKAGDVHKQIKVAGFGFSHIEIELGLVPSVRLQYKNDMPDAPLAVALLASA